MSLSTVVIGAGYGDEGKGLITDFEARRLNSETVVRFNGGAQAGHTVVAGDLRHIFSHVGAGTFAGANTHLSSNFIVNPFLLKAEHELLLECNASPRITVNAGAMVSTIYDMVLNAIAELTRSSNRHGSCGVGINETVTRHLASLALPYNSSHFHLTAGDLMNESRVVVTLFNIAKTWVPHRLKELESMLGSLVIPDHLQEMLDFPRAVHAERLMEIINEALFEVHTPRITGNAVFEGAQGLGLDEDLGVFPHVTRSKTGLPYAGKAAREVGIKEFDVVYVTRVYGTRHGAGPLAGEGTWIADDGWTPFERTNNTNEWQGKFRFAPLDLTALAARIKSDIGRYAAMQHKELLPSVKSISLAVTCLDQVQDFKNMNFLIDGAVVSHPVQDVCKLIADATSFPISHMSFGPCAKDVRHTEIRI